MSTTIHARRRSDAARARQFRASKKQRIERGVGVPDSRDVSDALLETVVRELRIAGVSGTTASIPLPRIVRTAVGCLVRDGFERTAAKTALKTVLDRKVDGPEPESFASGDRAALWSAWERDRAAGAAVDIETSLIALGKLGDAIT